MEFKDFLPSKRILMGPGPSNVHPRVLSALSAPTIGHLDPEFTELMDKIKQLLRYVFKTSNEVTFPISGPGSVGMEMCLVNLIERGDKVAVCQNGVFGGRMVSIVQRTGAEALIINDDWGRAVTPEKLEDLLSKNKEVKIAAFVHAETSTGALSDIKTLTKIAHDYGCITVADTVTSLGGSELRVDEWNLDVVYSGTQKCLSCPPGLSPVTFNRRALDHIKRRKSQVQSWFMDLNLILSYWGEGKKRAYHHTAPINSLYGLYEALRILYEEGIENSWERHKKNGRMFTDELTGIGLKPYVNEKERLSQLISVEVPIGVSEAGVRRYLLDRYNLEIGAGLGTLAGKVWRIGLMGFTSNEENVRICIKALGEAISENLTSDAEKGS